MATEFQQQPSQLFYCQSDNADGATWVNFRPVGTGPKARYLRLGKLRVTWGARWPHSQVKGEALIRPKSPTGITTCAS